MISVGVKRVSDRGGLAEPGDMVRGEITQQWVEINGQRITADDGLISVSYEMPSPGGSGVVTLKIFSTGFATVDWRD